jgi:hypothetical protein
MPPLCTFMPSTATAKWKVYVIRLHRHPIVDGSFVEPGVQFGMLASWLAGDI